MDSFIYSINATVPIFLVMIIGWFIKQIGLIDDHFANVANRYVFKVALPALLFRDLSKSDFKGKFDPQFVLYCSIVTILMFSLVWIATEILMKDDTQKGAFVQGSCRSSAAILGMAFVQDWNYAAKENLFLRDSLFEIPQYVRGGHDPVQIMSSGPDSQSKEIHDNYLRLIHHAKDHVYIQTPYFIPDDSILDALKIASQSGIDVRIMIPCKPDHPFVYWATYSYIGEMVAAGAKCYVYDNGFLHAKFCQYESQPR